MELNRLGIALLALSAFGAWDVSSAAQSEVAFASGSAPVVAGDQARSTTNSKALKHAFVARFLAARASGAASPAAILVQARRQHSAMPVVTPAAVASPAGAWQPVGPSQVVSPSFGRVTGRVTSVAIDPSDASGSTVYAGTTGGGVWKSTNATASPSQVVFSPLTDVLPAFSAGATASLSVGAVSVQPGGTGVVLAGTGDPNDALDSYYGSGLLRSTDRGVTWTLIERTRDALSGPYLFSGEGFAGFAWSTTSPNLVVAAVSDSAEGTIVNAPTIGDSGLMQSARGLYYSTDAGATWRLSTITDGPNKPIQGPNTVGWISSAATAVVWNPLRKMFYAAVRYHGYYNSPDGITWTRLNNQPGPLLNTTNCPNTTIGLGFKSCPIFRGALAVQSVTGDLFAFTVDENNKNIGLWQDACNLRSGACTSSTVAFATQVATTALETADGSHTITQGTYNLWLAAVPSLADTLLYTGTLDISRCNLLNGCVWRNTTNLTTCGAARVAPSQHAVDFLPGPAGQAFPGLMFFGNDGGLWRTTNGAQQPSPACSASDTESFDNLNESIGSLAEIAGLAQHPTDASVLLAGLGWNGTAATGLPQTAWPQVLNGEAATTAIDSANPQNWYTTSAPGVSIHRCTIGTACTPADFGQPAIGETQVGGDGLKMPTPAAFALDAKDPSQMLVGTCRVWFGSANGASWSASNAISPMLDGIPQPACNGNALVRSLAASPDASGEWLYAGMAGQWDGGGKIVPGHVFRARWAGSATAWTDVAASPVVNTSQPFNPGSFAVSSIVADAHDATGQTVYVTIEGFSGNGVSAELVYRTTDAGAHWATVNSNLPWAPANSLAVDPLDANTVYVALDSGVYVTRQISSCSDPRINCWSVYGTGLPSAPVTQLLVFGGSPRGSSPMLRAGTFGRGIWEIPLAVTQDTGTTAIVVPTSLAFADQPLQTTSASQTLVLTNTGTQPLLVTEVLPTGDFAQQNTCSTALAAQATCSILVSFNPAQLGPRTGSLTVSANIPSGQLTVALSGNGIQGANVVLLPSSMDFGTVITNATSSTQFLTISNIGGTTVALGTMAIAGPFLITANLCGASLAPTYGCTVGIAFSPTLSGTAPGSFSVADDAGTQTVPLSGIGATPASERLVPLTLTFPPQILATNSAPLQVILTNDGDSALRVMPALTTGDFSMTTTCGGWLPGHLSCIYSVVFHPTRAGQQAGTLTVIDQLATHTVALSGAGLAPAGISIAPTSLDFGGVGVGGSSAQSVTLTNNGGTSLESIAMTLSGDFTLAANGCTTSLPAGKACDLQVVFSPSQAGARSGNLTVTSSSATSFNLPLNGYGEDFQLIVSGSGNATVVTGQTAGFALSLVPIAGSSGNVTLTCAGAPANSICTVSPASAQVTGGNTVSIGVQVATGTGTKAGSAAGLPYTSHPGKAAGTGLLMLVLLLPVGWRLRRFRLVCMMLALSCLTFSPLGCGVSVSGGKPSLLPASINATPAGLYVLTITATSPGIQRSATLNLTVD